MCCGPETAEKERADAGAKCRERSTGRRAKMTTTQRIIQDVYQGHEGRAAAPSGTSARADPLWRVVQAWYNRCLGGERSKRFCALLPGGLPLPESGFLLRSEKLEAAFAWVERDLGARLTGSKAEGVREWKAARAGLPQTVLRNSVGMWFSKNQNKVRRAARGRSDDGGAGAERHLRRHLYLPV